MTEYKQGIALGRPIPDNTPHAVSVSLPTWRDVVGYEEGDRRVIDAMQTGYPRFFLNKNIQKLNAISEQKFASPNERCLVFPSSKIAIAGRAFMNDQAAKKLTPPAPLTPPIPIRIVQFVICPPDNPSSTEPIPQSSCIELHILLFPAEAYPLAKLFWQHVGNGISSRLAERCLLILAARGDGSVKNNNGTAPVAVAVRPTSPQLGRYASAKSRYSQQIKLPSEAIPIPINPQSPSTPEENLSTDQNIYVEERYGRNLPLASADIAKRALKRRIAGVLLRNSDPVQHLGEAQDVIPGESLRGVPGVSEKDVYLFPSGMSAIWSAHQLVMSARPELKSVCFGYPYGDTLKVLEKWGPGCHFFPDGRESDLTALESLLSSSPSPCIAGLFAEFPSNPLLRSPDLAKLRALADKYDFFIVVDETVGNFANVEVLPYVDIVVSSLTKVFSGEANVMGGSLVVNPNGRHYSELQSKLATSYEDVVWGEDAVFMERNSRDFARRVHVINNNTEALCDMLYSVSEEQHHEVNDQANGSDKKDERPFIIKSVFFPKFITRTNYDTYRIKTPSSPTSYPGGYGGLFSLSFTSTLASRTFFDSLPCAKGPSLGTNFTLACPFTILMHFNELEWAESYGVHRSLVRVSVGMEGEEVLKGWFAEALREAERVVREAVEAGKSLD